jgi:hypothetical protein
MTTSCAAALLLVLDTFVTKLQNVPRIKVQEMSSGIEGALTRVLQSVIKPGDDVCLDDTSPLLAEDTKVRGPCGCMLVRCIAWKHSMRLHSGMCCACTKALCASHTCCTMLLTFVRFLKVLWWAKLCCLASTTAISDRAAGYAKLRQAAMNTLQASNCSSASASAAAAILIAKLCARSGAGHECMLLNALCDKRTIANTTMQHALLA